MTSYLLDTRVWFLHLTNPSKLPAQLTAFVAERLSAHKRPRTVVFVEALPRNALGKVQKHLLR